MSTTLLLVMQDKSLSQQIQDLSSASNYKSDYAKTGQEAQGLLYKNQYTFVILELGLTDSTAIEVLKYIKLSKHSTKVILYVPDKNVLIETGLSDDKKLTKLGVTDILYAPLKFEALLKIIQNWTHGSSWRQISNTTRSDQTEEKKILDRELTHIAIKEVLNVNIAVFDHYIRLGPNKYVKVVHQGEPFPAEIIENYAKTGCEYLYFLTKDRVIYINFMNDLTEKMLKIAVPDKQVIKAIKSTTEKYIEEVHTQGIKPSLVDEGKKICQNMFDFISKDKNLYETLMTMEDINRTAFSHSFLVTFYSIIICKNINWIGKKALDTIALGCLFHDLGMLKLPAAIRESGGKNLSPNDLAIFKQHPKFGAEMLINSTHVNEQVRQIVYQHHELLNGTGYPNGLTGLKIYPLAKIVSLADGYTDNLLEMKITPRQVLRSFLQDRENVAKYDALMLRALVNGLI